MKMLVAGDVGATKTTLGLFDPENGPRSPLAQVTLESGRHDSFETLCRAFLADVRVPVHRASFGVPGSVLNGRVRTTNSPMRDRRTAIKQGARPRGRHVVQRPRRWGLWGAAVAVEQASTLGWERYVGLDGTTIGMQTFGASAPIECLQQKFGFTSDHVVETAIDQIQRQAERAAARSQ